MSSQPHREHPHLKTFGTLTYLAAGPIAWALHFACVYFVQSLLCFIDAKTFGTGLISLVIWIVSMAAAAILIALMVAPSSGERVLQASEWDMAQKTFQRRTMQVLATLSLFAIIATAFSTTIGSTCQALR